MRFLLSIFLMFSLFSFNSFAQNKKNEDKIQESVNELSLLSRIQAVSERTKEDRPLTEEEAKRKELRKVFSQPVTVNELVRYFVISETAIHSSNIYKEVVEKYMENKVVESFFNETADIVRERQSDIAFRKSLVIPEIAVTMHKEIFSSSEGLSSKQIGILLNRVFQEGLKNRQDPSNRLLMSLSELIMDSLKGIEVVVLEGISEESLREFKGEKPYVPEKTKKLKGVKEKERSARIELRLNRLKEIFKGHPGMMNTMAMYILKRQSLSTYSGYQDQKQLNAFKKLYEFVVGKKLPIRYEGLLKTSSLNIVISKDKEKSEQVNRALGTLLDRANKVRPSRNRCEMSL